MNLKDVPDPNDRTMLRYARRQSAYMSEFFFVAGFLTGVFVTVFVTILT